MIDYQRITNFDWNEYHIYDRQFDKFDFDLFDFFDFSGTVFSYQ